MTKNYIKKLIRLAEEIRELQLEESKSLGQEVAEQKLELSWSTIQLNSKLNYLIGYILALKEGK